VVCTDWAPHVQLFSHASQRSSVCASIRRPHSLCCLSTKVSSPVASPERNFPSATNFAKSSRKLHSRLLLCAMDPFTALSLAGTVVQFVDFGSKVISKGRGIYKDAEASADAQCPMLTKDLLDYSTKFEQSLKTKDDPRPLTDEQAAEIAQPERLCQDCRKMANDLLVRVEKLKVTTDGKHRGWESFQKAFLSTWSATELSEIQQKLGDYHKVLDSRVLRSLWQEFQAAL
jgi:hypothetical protein